MTAVRMRETVFAPTPSNMRSLLVMLVGLVWLAPAGLYGQTALVETVRVDFVRDRIAKGHESTPEVVEEGTLLIAPDGTYRRERLMGGARRVEIVKPGANQRIELDLDARRAFVGSLSHAWAAPSPEPQPVPGVAGLTKTSQELTRIGTKVVGGLTLEGTRDTTVLTDDAGQSVLHVIELWAYRFPDARVLPMILEIRAETPYDVDDRRITNVETVRVSREMFEIPRSFSVLNVRRP